MHAPIVQAREWSAGQQAALSSIRAGVLTCDANARGGSRFLYLCGEPGSGKSEVIVQAAIEAAKNGQNDLILCPTGCLVHSYRERLPDTDYIVVETIHTGFAISRKADGRAVHYATPSRL